jgi:hypothetical protein
MDHWEVRTWDGDGRWKISVKIRGCHPPSPTVAWCLVGSKHLIFGVFEQRCPCVRETVVRVWLGQRTEAQARSAQKTL